jgi:hypothetical protein
MRQNPKLLMRGGWLYNAPQLDPSFVRILRFDCSRSARKFSIASGLMSDNAVDCADVPVVSQCDPGANLFLLN